MMGIKIDVLAECLFSGLLLSWVIVHANYIRKSIIIYGRNRTYRTYPKPEPIVLLIVFIIAAGSFNDGHLIAGWSALMYLGYHYQCYQTSLKYKRK